MFKELKKGKNNEVEKIISENWAKMNILELTIKNRSDKNNFVFYDGPATANGMPGIHHMLAKLEKLDGILMDFQLKYRLKKNLDLKEKLILKNMV